MAPRTRSFPAHGRRRRPRWLVLAAVVLAALVLLLWPRQLGGASTYVITRGNSMEPGIHTGDLVIARSANDYGLGDVVAIDSQDLGITVLHRIVDRDGDRFVTQGDNNDWLDPERPTPDQILGRMWLRIPAGGKALNFLTSPAGTAGLATLALVGTGAGAKRLRRRSRRHRTANRSESVKLGAMAVSPIQRRQAAGVLALVAVVAGGVAAVAWAVPAERTVDATVPFTHRGELSYQASAPGSAVYDDDTVDTGEPVFLRVVSTVAVTFAYEAAGLADAPSGQISLAARLRGSSGWRRDIPLVPTRRFDDGTTEVTVDLDLARLAIVADRIDEEIGVSAGQRTVTLLPVVTLDGEDDGLPAAPFDPEIGFQLDAQVFRPADASGTPGEPITTTEPSTVPTSRQTDNHLTVLGRQLPVEPTRQAATGVAAAAAVLAVVALATARRSRLTDAERIAARYPGRIVTADHLDATSLPTVDLTTIDDLVRIAEREDRFILHVPATDEYLLHADTAVYRHSTSRTSPEANGDHGGTAGQRPAGGPPGAVHADAALDVERLLEHGQSGAVRYQISSEGTIEPDESGTTAPGGGRRGRQ